MVNSGQKTARMVICLALFALALGLRAYAADFGLFNGDERVNDAARVLAGELVPGQHFYPPLFNYINAVAFVGLFGFGLVTDMWSSTAEFRQAYFSDPTPFYVTARYVTAAIGALAAPLFFSVACRLGLSLLAAIVVGGFAAIFPHGVFMAHIAKGDTGLAVACLAVVWALLSRLESRAPARWDSAVGLFVALALSFKHNAILFLVPLAAFFYVVLARREGAAAALGSFGISVIVAIVLWPIFNIGVLLDLENFIAFQKIQAVMSVKEEEPFGIGLPITFAIFGDVLYGFNPVLLAIALLTPVWLLSSGCRLGHRDALLAVWLACAVSTVLTSLLVGTRQPEHLFIIAQLVGLLITTVTLMDMIRAYGALARGVLVAVATVGFGLMALGSKEVLDQAAAPTIASELAGFLSENYPDARIQTGLSLPVPQTRAAQQFEIARWDRVAAKYGIEMPELAPERIIREDAPDALFHVAAPFAMSGLEGDDAAETDFPVQPHAWPIQPEEWKLDNWLAEGFGIFVANDFQHLRNESRSSHIRAFYRDVEARCDKVRDDKARKAMFLEWDVTVFDCTALL